MNDFALPDNRIAFTPTARDLMQRRHIGGEEQSKFSDILAGFNASDRAPKEYLKTLSASELDIVRAVHGLAASINVEMLNPEGALNLLRQPGEFLDIDDDGVAFVGIGKTRVFPPQNASTSMRRAYEDAKAAIPGTKGRRELLAQIPFMAAEMSHNIKYDSNGQPCGVYQPGEPGWTNIYNQPGFSWQQLGRQMIANLELSKSGNSIESYRLMKHFLEDFSYNLEKYGVA